MSEFVEEDWKLKAHAVVKLRRENTNMLVSLSLPYIQGNGYVQARLYPVAYRHAYF